MLVTAVVSKKPEVEEMLNKQFMNELMPDR